MEMERCAGLEVGDEEINDDLYISVLSYGQMNLREITGACSWAR